MELGDEDPCWMRVLSTSALGLPLLVSPGDGVLLGVLFPLMAVVLLDKGPDWVLGRVAPLSGAAITEHQFLLGVTCPFSTSLLACLLLFGVRNIIMRPFRLLLTS